MHTTTLLKSHKIISDQVSRKEIEIILGQLEQLFVMGRAGTIVEFGCYVGTTSLFIQRLIAAYAISADFHVYDSFAGLPEKTLYDESPAGMQFVKGELSARKKEFISNFQKAHVKLPILHKAWFSELTPQDIPDDILFAYLDGDYYESIRDSLRAIEPCLQEHAVIVVDDYANEALPGAARAVDEWVRGRPHTLHTTESLAIIHLQS